MPKLNNFPKYNLERIIREVNILLISDLHYDIAKNASKTIDKAKEVNILLVDSLPAIGDDWEPDILVVAGDLVNIGKKESYPYYFDLIERITKKYPNLKNAVFSTPGNHDINRDNIVSAYNYLYSYKKKNPREKLKNSYTSSDIVNLIYTVSQFDLSSRKKKQLIEFLKDFEKEYFKTYLEKDLELQQSGIINNISKKYPVNGLSTIYIKDILGIAIVAINSSFFCNFSNMQNDRNNLFYIRDVVDKTIEELSMTVGPIVTFMHHPFFYMHESEFIYPMLSNPKSESNNFNKLAEKSDLILSGHVHGELHEPSIIHQKAYSITNGTTFIDDTTWKEKSYPLTYALIKVNKKLKKFRLQSYKYKNPTKGFEINNRRHSRIYYPFQDRPDSIENSPELEKINIVQFYNEIARNEGFSAKEILEESIKNQIKIYDEVLNNDIGKLLVKEKIFQKLKYILFQTSRGRKILAIKIQSKDYLSRLGQFFKSKIVLGLPKNSKIYIAINFDTFFDSTDRDLKIQLEKFTFNLRTHIMSSKYHHCCLNFIYY